MSCHAVDVDVDDFDVCQEEGAFTASSSSSSPVGWSVGRTSK